MRTFQHIVNALTQATLIIADTPALFIDDLLTREWSGNTRLVLNQWVNEAIVIMCKNGMKVISNPTTGVRTPYIGSQVTGTFKNVTKVQFIDFYPNIIANINKKQWNWEEFPSIMRLILDNYSELKGTQYYLCKFFIQSIFNAVNTSSSYLEFDGEWRSFVSNQAGMLMDMLASYKTIIYVDKDSAIFKSSENVISKQMSRMNIIIPYTIESYANVTIKNDTFIFND